MNLKDKGLTRGELGVFVACLLVGIMTWTSCGDVFRPIQQPIPQPPGDPKLFHFVVMISTNAPGFPGSATQIDVSGDTNLSVAALGKGPVYAAAQLPSASRFFAANASEDSVSSFSVSISGIGSPTVTSLPVGSKPSFLHSTENATMYVILSGTGTVGVIATSQGVLTQQVTVGANPVALAEMPNGKKLYVVNQGSNTVSVIDTTDHTVRATIPVGTSPAAAAASLDNSKIFVLNRDSGTVSVISTFSDTEVTQVPVATTAGHPPDAMYYDSTLNRLYVTNPQDGLNGAGAVSIFNVAGATPQCAANLSAPACQLTLPTLSGLTSGTLRLPGVTALTDGKHAYVLGYATVAADGGLASYVVSIDTLRNAAGARLQLATGTVSDVVTATIPQVCSPTERFRESIASAPDGSRVYVASCDAGGTYIVKPSDNTVLAPTCYPAFPLITAPYSALPPQPQAPSAACPLPSPPPPPPMLPPPQSPVFLLSGQ
jgi:YVTN family beta-propeller protein